MGLTADVASGEIIQSAWGNAIRNRTAQQFADAAQRAAQWPAPPLGALSVLDTWPGSIHQWTGTHWVVDQSAYVVMSTSPDSTIVLVFPRPFVGDPPVFWTQGEATAAFAVIMGVFTGQLTPTQAALSVRTITGGATGTVPSQAVGFHWWARGRSS